MGGYLVGMTGGWVFGLSSIQFVSGDSVRIEPPHLVYI